jgi:hypothetical protein
MAAAQSIQTVPAETLLNRAILTALDAELSGVAAKDHVSRLTQFHRVPASPGFHDAIEYVRERAIAIGLTDVHVETFPGDGKDVRGKLVLCDATPSACHRRAVEERGAAGLVSYRRRCPIMARRCCG